MTSLLLGFLLAMAESGVGLGAVLPGEVAITALATTSSTNLPLLAAAVALGASAGDHVGYLVGRLGGTRLRGSRLVARVGTERWDRAAAFVQRHGFWAMLGSRVLPVVRTMTPLVAGAAHMPYAIFLAASLSGAALWAAIWVGAGAGITASGALGHPMALLALGTLLAVVALVVRRRKRHHASMREQTHTTPEPARDMTSVMCVR